VLTCATAADRWQQIPQRLATGVVLHRVTDRIAPTRKLDRGGQVADKRVNRKLTVAPDSWRQIAYP